MLSCKEITELVTEYLEQDLPWRKRLGVRMHLWMCSRCRTYMDQIRKVIGITKGLPAQPPPPEVMDSLLAKFREKRD